MIEILKNTNVDFIGFRKKAFVVSAILVAAGFFAFVMVSLGKANISVDFTGGTSLLVRFSEQIDIATLRKALSGSISDVQVQEISGTRDFFIKTKLSDTAAGQGPGQSEADSVRPVSQARSLRSLRAIW